MHSPCLSSSAGLRSRSCLHSLLGARDGGVVGYEFARYATQEMEALNTDFSNTQEHYIAVAKYYGEDPQHVQPEELFNNLNNFITNFRVRYE